MIDLGQAARNSRAAYLRLLAGGPAEEPWWSIVVLTASSSRQAARYEEEIRRRRLEGKLPPGAQFLVVPDQGDRRLGSGGATLHALRELGRLPRAAPREPAWWESERVFLVHSGGDSRRLPQYSLSGKLFSPLPVKTPWGDTSTVFDEYLALSTAWAARLKSGLLVSSGDVILVFDAAGLEWDRPGVCGVAIRQPAATGAQHGVYVLGDGGQVYRFLQKPSAAQVRAAGGMLAGGEVALDTGLLRFDPALAARLSVLVAEISGELPVMDLYEQFTLALTGRWRPAAHAPAASRRLAAALEGAPFHCSVVPGEFTHVGTTTHFRRVVTEDTAFSRLFEAHQRTGGKNPPGVRGAGVVLDSMLASGAELGSGAVVIECDLEGPVRAGAGAILHGLTGIPGTVEVPADVVAHQVPVATPGMAAGVVVRVYGVGDDPKATLASGHATWFGRPVNEVLTELGIKSGECWPAVPRAERSLWNARLFPVLPAAEAWDCARWLAGVSDSCSAARWREAPRQSLAESSMWADLRELAAAQAHRRQGLWRMTALELARAGTDLRPMLAYAPGVAPLAETGRALAGDAEGLVDSSPTEAASRYAQSALFLEQAGLTDQAAESRIKAFACVRRAVESGVFDDPFAGAAREWRRDGITVWAPPRMDFGGGWSDTPPFCLDWGGTVLNLAVELGGACPIGASVRRLEEPVVRCISEAHGETAEYRDAAAVLAYPEPGSPFAIPRAALALAGVVRPEETLASTLARYGGGLEIRTVVDLPMGSGLGTSSILAATLLRALAGMLDCPLSEETLCDQVMRLEQHMTTGGGWQDQVGGIWPGAKLAISGPGLRQRVRVEPVAWSRERQEEFASRFVLYYTGIRRVAKDLLAQVVGSYLAREASTLQVLHSIKTLALEMAHAMRAGEWDYLGRLLDRHWDLNRLLDPNTTNAPISALLRDVRPYVSGAKLAGAGGGGFLMLLARDPQTAGHLRAALAERRDGLCGAVYDWSIAREGLRVEEACTRPHGFC